jgi:hypothetical protein
MYELSPFSQEFSVLFHMHYASERSNADVTGELFGEIATIEAEIEALVILYKSA